MNEQTADTLGAFGWDHLQRGGGGRQLDRTERQREQLDGATHLRVGSLFTGIGGFDLGLERAGHRIVFQCEKDEYRRRVLKRHWPDVPCWADVVHIRESASGSVAHGVRPPAHFGRWEAGSGLPSDIDLLCGGFPCQDLSVAGRRAGLAGERSGLFFEFARIADDLLGSGGWMLIENVPGLLSSNNGRDFAVLLSTLAELGFHDLAWRVLDSRYLGVPQRRRRVFILARRSRGRRASEVLLEPESGGGDFEAGTKARQGVAGSVADGADTARSLTASEWWDGETEDFIATGPNPLDQERGSEQQYPEEPLVRAGRGDVGNGTPPHPDRVRAASGVSGRVDVLRVNNGGADPLVAGDAVDAVASGGGQGGGATHAIHLTQDPITEENGTPALGANAYLGVVGVAGVACALDPKPDGPRYAACGDAVTTTVAYWIGLRLAQVGE